MLSDIAADTLRELLNPVAALPESAPAQLSLVLTMTEIQSAVAPIEELLDRLDGSGTTPNRWLARQVGKEPAVTHRRCCLSRSHEWQRQATMQALPFERTCDDCGSVWQIHMAPRRI